MTVMRSSLEGLVSADHVTLAILIGKLVALFRKLNHIIANVQGSMFTGPPQLLRLQL